MLSKKIRSYYYVKIFIPRPLQIALRRWVAVRKHRGNGAHWPIDERTVLPPDQWAGWPDGKSFALVLTHDVEGLRGYERCLRIADLEERLGFRSSFNFVAEDYPVSSAVRDELTRRGFEVGIHGLTHDGSLYHSKTQFRRQAARINELLRDWKAVGFRSPCMYHNLDWLHDLDIEYDSSTLDTDPFEPQPDSLHCIFPVLITGRSGARGYVELPYTLPQDFTLFVLLGEQSIEIWKKKLRWIVEKGGLALLNTHPDYMRIGNGKMACDEYPVERYGELLRHIKDHYGESCWHVLPRELARFWLNRHQETEAGGDGAQRAARSAIASGALAAVAPARAAQRARLPLRVCMVAYTFYDADNRVKRYAESLARRGDQVDVVALQRGDQETVGFHNGVRIYRIQKRTVNEKARITYLWRLLAFLARSFRLVTSNHLRTGYDLIHVHNVPDFEVLAAIIPKITGAKVILDIHDILPEFYASKFNARRDSAIFKLLWGIEKISCALSDHVIVSNDLWSERLVGRSVKPSKCSTILNYPDASIFRFAVNGKPRDRFTLLYPGTLNWHQGLDVAVKAVSLVREQLPQAEFHIYGEGPERESLIKLAYALGVQDRVFLHGFVPIEEAANLMRGADLGIVPKRASGFGDEAFSTKIPEFMALGVPVVASSTTIDRYYFDDSMIRFFESENAQDLANAILEMAFNESLRERLRKNAVEFAASLSWEVKQDIYLELVDKLVGEKR